MKTLRNVLLSTVVAVSALAALPAAAAPVVKPTYQHVLLISVDGMHAVDLQKWIETHPTSAIAKLSQHGVVYPNTFTTAPSDSYPGMIAQATGASPKTATLFYDDSYDRTAYPAGSNCVGAPGAEITNFEAIDNTYAANPLVTDYTAGGTLGKPLTQIDTTQLQLKMINGVCTPQFPHDYLQVNTMFEVLKAAGMATAWSDKHPAYEILGGKTGAIDDLFSPEINAQDTLDAGAQPGDDYTKSFKGVRTYDAIKVQAVINWIDGWNSTRTTYNGAAPAIFGMNFQAVSVGQKLAKAGDADFATPTLTGGYLDGNATPGSALSMQLNFVDQSIGKMVSELVYAGIDSSTLIIISAKHGQSPIDRTVRQATKVIDNTLPSMPGYGFHICDDEALIWLDPAAQKTEYAAAEAFLKKNASALHIMQLLDRSSLTPLYGNPMTTQRVPDFIAVTDHGVICTGGSKLAEHGGFSNDDRNVAMLVAGPGVIPGVSEGLTYTTQIAPTVLWALGQNPGLLDGVKKEGTKVMSR